MNLHKQADTQTEKYTLSTTYSSILIPKPLISCLSAMCKTRTHWAGFSWPANQRLNRTFVITIALYLSIRLRTFKTIPSHPCLSLCNHFRSNAQNCLFFFIINQEWGSIKKGGVGERDGWGIAVERGGTKWWGSPALCLIAVSECACKKGALH